MVDGGPGVDGTTNVGNRSTRTSRRLYSIEAENSSPLSFGSKLKDKAVQTNLFGRDLLSVSGYGRENGERRRRSLLQRKTPMVHVIVDSSNHRMKTSMAGEMTQKADNGAKGDGDRGVGTPLIGRV
ncbi:hypothetical protein NP493_385g01033 [Ridgeia piscesae]|uniref:Uncharacterized protein n=1 Tax=Ridgeia piscesae TaxID=27915 RepID=A0AAD9NTE5_RIDPI|nr:hypothetical protein NP493_385g01033 [Ridgeia piscesae]